MALSVSELAAAQADFASVNAVTSCQIQRQARTQVEGGYSETWTTVATVNARFSPISARELLIGGETAAQSDAVATLPVGTDVRQPDRIVAAGNSYEVTDVRTRVSEALVLRVYIKLTT